MIEFKGSDFVQVKHEMLGPDGVEVDFWRNALYTGCPNGHHSVIYTNGDCEVVVRGKLRKAVINNQPSND